ncbi:UNVERIFIED_CONTAM: hypothetical protein RMT77_006717 [Armadillidium vulgare]
MSIIIDEKEVKEKLIKNMKKEVKQIMEEAVTRKFVHEESGSITSLCAAVEACLSHGLKRRTLGLFKTSSTTALIHKVGKTFEPASLVSKKVLEIEAQDPRRRSNSSGDSRSGMSKPPLAKKNSGSVTPLPKYLWIRIALFQKVLSRIIDHLVENCNKYYEKDALAADPDYGTILSSLLVGPCALDYSRMKTIDHLWTDPPADELVQRHRISSGHLTAPATPPATRRPGLHYRKPVGTSTSEDGSMGSFASPVPPTSANSVRSLPSSAREYVESLHQNSRAALLYGKNNVQVQPKEHVEPMPGYLSLHQIVDSLVIKWTPNHLMNGCCGDSQNKSIYWEYALNVRVEEIVYVHCHQQSDSGGTIVLVGQDGTQYPPIHFPKGGHLLAFLSCLENGLLPHGQLDPPLWSQRGKGKVFPKLRRKARALMNGRSLKEKPLRPLQRQEEEAEDEESKKREENPDEERKQLRMGMDTEEGRQLSEEDETSDYVFRILTSIKPEKISHMDLMSPLLKGSSWFPRVPKLSSHSSSTSSSKSLSLGDSLSDAVAPPPTPIPTPTPAPSLDVIISGDTLTVANGGQVPSTDSADQEKNSDSLEILCSTMKHQIISRAFYGWLAHCRHLRTVRTHLAGLVLPSSALPLSQNTEGWKEGLTEAIWRSLTQDGRITDKDEIRGRVYFGGIEHTIRKEVWPYLLEHFEFGSTEEEREELDLKTRQMYEGTMSEWLAVEAIVRQRDKETMAMNLAKLSSESQSGDLPVAIEDKTLINESISNSKVFEPDDDASLSSNDNPPVVQDDDDVEEEVVVEEDLKGNEKEEKDLKNCESEERPCQDQLSSSATTEKLLSKESSYEDAKSPTCVVTPDEGVSEGPDSETICSPEYEDAMSAVDDDAAADTEVKELTEEICARLQEEEEREKRTPMNSRMASEDPSEKDNLTITEGSEPKGLEAKSPCISPASSHGGIYSTDLLESFGLNLHRIDKDVQRCDRHYWYFQKCNLEKLRNVMCTYVWEHLDTGYMQGMCDLAAPLLVIFDDEAMTYACFCHLMNRMSANFPNGGAMDQHFANMRSLIQILDSEMFELMHQNGDYTHFYFCYRWFLLDFKRELVYEDVFTVWEVIWAARYVSSGHFVLFIALALVQYYRAIILENSMDFTDIIKFFNEMAERHEAKAVLKTARNLVTQLQTLIENK